MTMGKEATEKSDALEGASSERIGGTGGGAMANSTVPNGVLERVRERNSDVLLALSRLNARLVNLSIQIKKSQPKRHGAVLLQLSECGRGCIGCPHPRWQRWVNRNVENPLNPPSWFAVTLKSPLAATRKLEYTEETRDLIREAIDVLRHRTALVAALNSVNQVIKQRKLIEK